MKSFPQSLRELALASSEADRESFRSLQALTASTPGDANYPDLFIAREIALDAAVKATTVFKAALAIYLAGERK